MKWIALLFLLVIVTPAYAATARNPLSVYGGLEQRYSKLALPLIEGKSPKEFDNQVLGTVRADLEIKPGFYLTGKLGYPFSSKLPEYSLGLEIALYGQK